MSSMFTRARPEGCVSDLVLDRLVAGELLDADERHHAETCAACGARLATLRADVAAFAEPAPRPAATARPSRPVRWPLHAGAGALAAAAIALLAVVALRPAPDAGLRRKGADTLTFHVKRGVEVFPGGPGETLHPGDALRFSVSVATARWVLVLSRDGGGHASVYVPATHVSAGEGVPMPTATLLDAQLGTEQLVGVFCDAPPPEARLLEDLRSGRALAAPPGCTVDLYEVEKVK